MYCMLLHTYWQQTDSVVIVRQITGDVNSAKIPRENDDCCCRSWFATFSRAESAVCWLGQQKYGGWHVVALLPFLSPLYFMLVIT